jgi:hypothetical protein
VFIAHEYPVKGVPGRLLIWMLDAYRDAGRLDFTNREIRADAALRLPELKDNLETRLLLLQRRLEEKRAPVRLLRPARGRIRWRCRAGWPSPPTARGPDGSASRHRNRSEPHLDDRFGSRASSSR